MLEPALKVVARVSMTGPFRCPRHPETELLETPFFAGVISDDGQRTGLCEVVECPTCSKEMNRNRVMTDG